MTPPRKPTALSLARIARARRILIDEGLGMRASRMPAADQLFLDLMSKKVMAAGASERGTAPQRDVSAEQLRRLVDLGRKYK